MPHRWLKTVHSINDHEDAFERMLAVLRFTFSKDIRHIVRFLLLPASLQYSCTYSSLSARETLQAVQLCSWREVPHALGRFPNLL